MQVSLNSAQLNGGPAVKRPGSGNEDYFEIFVFHEYRQVQRFWVQGSRFKGPNAWAQIKVSGVINSII